MSLDDVRRKLVRDVAEHGWSALQIIDDPPFSYTVGVLQTEGQPEAVICGLPHQQSHGLLACYVDRVREGFDVRAHERIDKIIRGFDMALVPCAGPLLELFTAARWYSSEHGDGSVEVVQLVWPDPQGLFPWEAGHQIQPQIQTLPHA